MKCRPQFDAVRQPNYFILNPKTLVTTSQPLSFTIGTGTQVLSSALATCLETKHELIFVTCFWSKKSKAREDITLLLHKLSEKALAQKHTIQVRICFSSHSPWRRLHPSVRKGKMHHPRSWKRLGLPKPKEIQGLHMVVKSIFVPPFSVMHPKFILMDRKKAWMPSCNVSRQNWFEGCIEMEGEITEKIYEFWVAFWGKRGAELPPLPLDSQERPGISSPGELAPGSPVISQTAVPSHPAGIPTILLPSPHHWNPRFSPLWIRYTPHTTPFTTFLQHIFRAAKSSIYIQTPNLTYQPVIRALTEALKRGVDVHIITSRHLMVLEQLATAGRITECEVRRLGGRYSHLKKAKTIALRRYERASRRGQPVESPPRLGSLSIGYYKPKSDKSVKDPNEPVKSHLKFVCIDDEVTILGSGNMDRASWMTSQELGIAFFSRDLAIQLAESVEKALDGRVKYAYELSM